MAHLLGVESVHVDFGMGTVLGSVTLGLQDGDRLGIVGANGAGKSTLLKILAGRFTPHDGRVTSARGTRVGVLDQSDHVDTDLTVLEAIVGDKDTHEWASDPRIRDVMSGLVPDLPPDAVVGSLSGGQQRRVALAHVLVGEHDVLILDEPTNHLDVEGVTWLAEHLKQRWPASKSALAVVTHDRWFLDEVTTATWEVHDGEVDQYEGGYAAYVLQRVERERIANVTEQRRQNLMRKELAWLRRGAPARTSKPKFRIDAANALIADVPPLRDPIKLQRMATARLGRDVVELIRASVSYGDKQVLKEIDWNLGPGQRVGLLGENGAGKSTLLKLITGELEPTSGRVKRGLTVKVAALSQQLAELEEHKEERVSALVKRFSSVTLADGSELTPGQLLERLGFSSSQLKTPVGRLSGGQRRRLQLLVVLLSEPNVLVLDEPTNDLDTDMLAALEDLLDAWPGTLVVVSHDRYLMERVTDEQFAVIDGGLRHLPGGVDEYVQLSRARRRGSGGVGTFGQASVAAAPKVDAQAQRAAQKELQAVERRMSRVAAEIEKLHAKMADHDQSDYAGIAALARDLQAFEAENTDLEERWLELSEALG
ncbi:ABC-F family ATP-binding cassette domain-containing protein [Demequina sp.]|uniref:ABC-F family ATP-binding cassette domain-containing protein n=1 Tax=Demequina sp. TaxID=2050685 RepID=UPI003D097758